MREIQPDVLWIGHALDVRQPRRLFDAGIMAVVDVAYEESPAQTPRELIYCHFPLVDGGGNDAALLLQAVQCTVDLLAAGTRTIVGCSAGMSRSPTIAAFALAAHLDQSPDEVIARIAASQLLEVNGPLWNDVAHAFAKIRPGKRHPD